MKRLIGALLLGTASAAGIAGLSLAAGMYDGTYHGSLTGADGNASTCAKKAPVEMTVTNNQLVYNHMGHATITATVGADGSFSGSAQNNYSSGGKSRILVQTLTGKIVTTTIQAETKAGESCTYQLSLKKF